jgi:hypothetical protein
MIDRKLTGKCSFWHPKEAPFLKNEEFRENARSMRRRRICPQKHIFQFRNCYPLYNLVIQLGFTFGSFFTPWGGSGEDGLNTIFGRKDVGVGPPKKTSFIFGIARLPAL